VPSGIKLIVGLGNPGPEHIATRHNAGFWFVDQLSEEYSLHIRPENKFQAELCRWQTPEFDCRVAKPMTYMNRSGIAVATLLNFFKIPAGEMLVVHDEIDLDAGVTRLKFSGGHGGNNGLRDIIEHLGNRDFYRLRIGVGHPGSSDKVTPHVLGRPTSEEEKLILQAIDEGLSVLPELLQGEYQKAITKLHTQQRLATSNKQQVDNNDEEK